MKTALITALLCTACAEETILAARDSRPLDAGDDERHDGGGERTACRDDSDCSNGDFCDKPGCDAVYGECARTDGNCGADATPLCGCDGMTYFNDCLRRRSSVSVASREPCRETALSCRDQPDCGDLAYCVRMSTPMSMDNVCSPDAVGQCWIMPARCNPEPQGGDGHFLCQEEGPGGDGPGDGPGECLDLCSAIISGRPFVRVWDCNRPWSPP